MTTNVEYIKYFKFFLESLAKTKQTSIKKMMINGQVCPTKINNITGLPEDNTLLNDVEFILDCMLQHEKAIKLFQRSEYFEEYKYSMYYRVSGMKAIDFKKLDSNIFLNEDQLEYLNEENKIEKVQIINMEGKIYFKISFKLETYVTKFYTTAFTKLSFIGILNPISNELEIRFNGLVSPFKTSTISYLQYVNLMVEFIKDNLGIEIIPLNFSFLTLKQNRELIKKEHHVALTDADFDDFGSASLRSNEENKRPYVDEIEELLLIKEKELGEEITPVEKNMFNYVQREVLDFLRNKDDEARYKKIVINFGSRGFKTNFSFTYGIDSSNCIVHHEYLKLKEEGRLDNVKDIIFGLEKQFNSSRDS